MVSPTCVPDTGTSIWTVDNISAVSASSVNIDVPGTAGVSFVAAELGYISDGSGGLVSGSWYKADADLTYASVTPQLGFAVNNVSAGNTGSFRLVGRVEGLTGLSPGSTYYVSATEGAITAVAPANIRFVGQSDTTTTLVASPDPPMTNTFVSTGVDPKIKTLANGRITLTSQVPVTTTDVTGATTIYFTPFMGNEIALYTGTTWKAYAFTQLSLAVPATTNTMYDLYVYDNASTLTLEAQEWDSSVVTITIAAPGVVTWGSNPLSNGDQVVFTTTGVLPTGLTAGTTYYVVNRAAGTFEVAATKGGASIVTTVGQSGVHTAHSLSTHALIPPSAAIDGVYTKFGFTTRRYLGSFKTGAVSGQTEDSLANRLVWNYYNRQNGIGRVLETENTWNYTTDTWRQAFADTANQINMVVGIVEDTIEVQATGLASNGGAVTVYAGIGLNLTTDVIAGSSGMVQGISGTVHQVSAKYDGYPILGSQSYVWLERSEAAGTTAWYGDNGGSVMQSGITLRMKR